ncbi:MAG TPA: patatin-like phospholipase family protein [Salinivirga sp.]|uniref:patatin-like phospholipase family protein n=1 Tax=Salinivirga sp. TaxID=1970192 RepID=UPI002B49A470|nr:patatin-like phospholipase family protein [Salinivirga sp.]HKK60853.1 patatin-like phospholipase family protein [Salinivirga sp.]
MKQLLVLILIVFLTPLILSGQSPVNDSTQRPKIGLVLSGGGAKGMAHVGFLKVMEEVGIEPDFITGTSMGSIVGGLYSIGYSADEIGDLLRNQNWNEVLSNDIKLSDISINEKDSYGQYFAEFPIQGIEIKLPKGLIFGQRVMELLNHYTLPAYNIHDFDSLPIPFKCVAADITNAEPVVMDTGNLAMAMRASMAIPTVFTPVLWGEKLLVDGGLSRNFPVEEVKNMGADIVIGVYTGGVLKDKESLNSMIDILTQSAFFMGIFDAEEQKKMVDIYIEPDLNGYTAADFVQVDSIIHRGEQATLKVYHQLDSLQQTQKQYQQTQEPTSLSLPDSIVVQKIVTRGIAPKYTAFVKARLGVEPNKPFHINQLEDGINRIYGSRYFYRVYYGFEDADDGAQVLVIYAEGKPTGFLGASVHYDSEKRAALLLNATFRDLVIPSSRLSLTANLSENPGFQVDFFKYFGKKRRYTIGTQFNTDAFDVPVYTMGDLSRLYKYNYTSYELYTRYALTNDSRISGGGMFERTSVKPKVHNTNDFKRWLVKNKQLYASFELNTTNTRYFPTRGLDLSLRYEYNFDLNYDITLEDTISNFESEMFNKTFGSLKFHLDYYQPVWDQFTFHAYSHAGLTFGENFTLVKQYMAGGIFTAYSYLIPFTGFNELEYTALQILSGGSGLQYELFTDIFIEPRVNILLSADYIEDFINTSLEERFILGYGLKLGYSSIIGPVVVSVSSNTYNNKVRSFFNLGYRFRF